MHFSFTRAIEAPRPVVEAAFGDPSFYEALSSGATSGVQVVSVLDRQEEGAGVVTVSVRMRFVADLSATVRRFVDPAKLTWVNEVRVSTETHGCTFEISPDHYAELLRGHGSYRFAEAPARAGAGGEDPGDGRTSAQVEGELTVRVPVVGRAAERAIVSGYEDFVAAQARVLQQWRPG